MIRFSQRLQSLPGYPLAEIPSIKRRLLAAGVDVIDLGAGDNDTPPPTPVLDAMREALARPALHKYGFQQGLGAFREAVARWMHGRFGLTIDPYTEVLPLLGSKEGLSHLPHVVCDEGDVVIVPEPGYQAYIGGSLLAGARPVVVPLRADRDFLLGLDQVPEADLARAKLLFLNYPNNPTAAVAPVPYLRGVIEACRQRGILLAYDNAYSELTFDGYVAPGILQLEGARDVAIEYFSLSKSYSMTGWRIGFAVGRPELIGALTRVKSYTDTGPWLAIQQAAVTALDRSEEFVAPVRAELQARRDAAVEALRAAGFRVEPPRAAMYLWVPLPDGVSSRAFATKALEERGVVVLPGSGFGPGGEGFFRIALTVGAPRLREAAARLGEVLAEVTGTAVGAAR
ncbi:MAG: aminotransferase class I/II-fold pyridoxal phosphate-dependent enzyme [Gemmatimonadales bacterium]|nr:aminotransferase class I/II-fold pyridoxal phosphate-dependent enzyme [Gemmatimonadales bacterium]